mgnify:CR=1 FL=1
MYNEALEKMLVSWTSLLNDAEDHFGRGLFKTHATQIFNAYVQCHSTQQGNGECKWCPSILSFFRTGIDLGDKAGKMIS